MEWWLDLFANVAALVITASRSAFINIKVPVAYADSATHQIGVLNSCRCSSIVENSFKCIRVIMSQ